MEQEQQKVSGVIQRQVITRRIVFIVILLLLAVAALRLWLRAPPDSVYKGRRLSSYLYDLRQRLPRSITVHDDPAVIEGRAIRHAAAVDALRALGPRSSRYFGKRSLRTA